MISNKEQRIKEIDKEIAKVGIIDAPGTIMFGLGLYAKFAPEGNAFLPILNNQTIVNAMLALGSVIMIWGVYKTYTLVRERSQLSKKF